MRSEGFTLIEIMIVGATLVAIGFGMLGVRDLFLGSELTAFNTYSNISDTNVIVTEFVNEARKAQDAETGSFAFESMGDFEIIFYSDIDFDGDTERVRYTLVGTRVEKGIVEPSGSPVTYDIGSEIVKPITDKAVNGALPMLYYYNQGWPTDTSNNPLDPSVRLSDTHLISIHIIVNNQEGAPDQAYSLESFTQPRILKSNL